MEVNETDGQVAFHLQDVDVVYKEAYPGQLDTVIDEDVHYSSAGSGMSDLFGSFSDSSDEASTE